MPCHGLGPEEVETGLETIGRKLSSKDFMELVALRAIMPNWIAEPASAMVADGSSAASTGQTVRS